MKSMQTSAPSTHSKADQTTTIINIQILRFFAAALVVSGHAQIYIMTRNLTSPNFQAFDLFNFQVGVDIFFIISGFVMYYVSKDHFAVPRYRYQFLVKRLIRILPLYWAVTLVMVSAAVLFPTQIRHSHLYTELILCSLLFIPLAGSVADTAFPIVGVGWTLNYEMFFYMCFFFALRLSRLKAITVLVLCFGAAVLVHFIFMSDTYIRFLSEWTNPIILEFILGITLAIFYSSGFRWSLWFGLAIALGGIVLMILVHHDIVYTTLEIKRPLIWGLPSLSVCAGLILIRRDDTARGLLTRLSLIGGDISYALYLTHEFTFNIICIVWRRFTSHGDWLLSFVLFFASIAVAIVVHYGFERPVTRALSRIAKRREKIAAAGLMQKSPELT